MARKYAVWGEFEGAWFAILKSNLDVFLNYDKKGEQIPIGFLELSEGQDWLKKNQPGKFRLVYIDADTIKARWGYKVEIVYDIDSSWIPGSIDEME